MGRARRSARYRYAFRHIGHCRSFCRRGCGGPRGVGPNMPLGASEHFADALPAVCEHLFAKSGFPRILSTFSLRVLCGKNSNNQPARNPSVISSCRTLGPAPLGTRRGQSRWISLICFWEESGRRINAGIKLPNGPGGNPAATSPPGSTASP